MIRFLSLLLVLLACLFGCSSQKGTIGQLRQVDINLEEEKSDVDINKAIESYEQFLDETGETPMTAEAIRRLADLKVEKEYGLLAETETAGTDRSPKASATAEPVAEGKTVTSPEPIKFTAKSSPPQNSPAERKTANGNGSKKLPADDDLERAGAVEAVALYRKLLDQYPDYEQRDQVLYQLSRAYEEQGKVNEAMQVMDRLVVEFPRSRYLAEVQFRRAESFFTRRKYSDAVEAYGSVVAIGEKSEFYLRAMYKLGWSYYKQEQYEKAVREFIGLLDYKVANGFDLNDVEKGKDAKRVGDTLRIISQSFSNLGGVNAVVEYFSRFGSRPYADVIYANLGEYYFGKQRYNDAATTYTTFVERQPFHRQSPLFGLRVIDINEASGFPSLVIDAKRDYANRYAFGKDYWKHHSPDDRPEVLAGLKVTLIDLSSHYHALYQNKKLAKKKKENFDEAVHWYREYISSFPRTPELPGMNYQLAELLLENKSHYEAAQEFEKVAFVYPNFDKSEKAGYAAVYAYREHLKKVGEEERDEVRRDIIRASLRFARTYPANEKAVIVFSAAVDDLYALKEYRDARIEARYLVQYFPKADKAILRSAWLVLGHASYELEKYADAEEGYTEVLARLPENDKKRQGVVDNLAASIYKQGEAANRSQRYKRAAEHFLRVAKVAPGSKIRPAAEYDAAVALIKVEEWPGAADVLVGFRQSFPKHELQPEVTKKLAYVYREDGRMALAAAEFERIASEAGEPELRQEALLTSAELFEEVNDLDRAATVYRRYVDSFAEPVITNLETRDKLAAILKKQGEVGGYHDQLRQIVSVEAAAEEEQNDRTRSLASSAALVLARVDYEEFVSIKLVKPFDKNLQRKQAQMKKTTTAYTQIFEYEIGDVTAEGTYYLAEIYADFSNSLLTSERPEDLSALELEQYELALEEQAYPFEEKAIEVHQSNLELMSQEVYNDWIEKSLARLATFMPARYAKSEVANTEIAAMSGFRFEIPVASRILQNKAARAAAIERSGLKPEPGSKERAQ